METPMDSPGISILKPPRIFLACFLAGAFLEWLQPSWTIPDIAFWWISTLAGVLITGAGLAFMGWAHGRFVAVGTEVRT